MTGSLPAGNYLVEVTGPQAARDAQVHFELALRKSDGPEVALASADATAGAGVDGGNPGALRAVLPVASAFGACSERLILRARVTSASSPYLEFLLTLTTP